MRFRVIRIVTRVVRLESFVGVRLDSMASVLPLDDVRNQNAVFDCLRVGVFKNNVSEELLEQVV